MEEKNQQSGRVLAKTKLFTATSLLFLAGSYFNVASAIGMADIQVTSALNEPFQAQIPIMDLGKLTLDDVKVHMATNDKFQEVGMDYPSYLGYLTFEVAETRSGRPVINITSEKPMDEPILNFLVEMNTSGGDYYREYTVFLDPPLYNTLSTRSKQVPSKNSEVISSDTPKNPSRLYGPTTPNDTLWSIATKFTPANANVEQTAVAIFEANEKGFIADNMNGLKAQQRLVIPSAEDIALISKDDAALVVTKQNMQWAARTAQNTSADNVTTSEADQTDTYTAEAGENPNASGQQQSLPMAGAAGTTGANPAPGTPAELQNAKDVKGELAYVVETLENLRESNRELTTQLQGLAQQNQQLSEEMRKKDEMILNLEQLMAAEKKGKSGKKSTAHAAAKVESASSSSGSNTIWFALPLLTLLGLFGYLFYKKRTQPSSEGIEPSLIDLIMKNIPGNKPAASADVSPEPQEKIVPPVSPVVSPAPAEKPPVVTTATPAQEPALRPRVELKASSLDPVIEEEDLSEWYNGEDEALEPLLPTAKKEEKPVTAAKEEKTTPPVQEAKIVPPVKEEKTAPPVREMDFEFGLGEGLKPEVTEKKAEPPTAEKKSEGEKASFGNLTLADAPLAQEPKAETVEQAKEEPKEESEEEDTTETSPHLEALDTKLDLARTYLNMGEYSAAIKLLDDVLQSQAIKKSQRVKAEALIEKARAGEEKDGKSS